MHLENSFNRMEIANVANPPIDVYNDLSTVCICMCVCVCKYTGTDTDTDTD
jgi:hypothetical protein